MVGKSSTSAERRRWERALPVSGSLALHGIVVGLVLAGGWSALLGDPTGKQADRADRADQPQELQMSVGQAEDMPLEVELLEKYKSSSEQDRFLRDQIKSLRGQLEGQAEQQQRDQLERKLPLLEAMDAKNVEGAKEMALQLLGAPAKTAQPLRDAAPLRMEDCPAAPDTAQLTLENITRKGDLYKYHFRAPDGQRYTVDRKKEEMGPEDLEDYRFYRKVAASPKLASLFEGAQRLARGMEPGTSSTLTSGVAADAQPPVQDLPR